MNNLAKICWVTAPIYALVGMAFGIYMSATGDHSLSPAHGHVNLLGWVAIAIYGTFYALAPRAADTWAAKLQVLLAQVGAITIFPGIIFAIQGAGETMAKVASVIVLLSMLLFLGLVLREALRPAQAA